MIIWIYKSNIKENTKDWVVLGLIYQQKTQKGKQGLECLGFLYFSSYLNIE